MKKTENHIFIATIQFLEEHFSSSKNSEIAYRSLSRNIDIIFFDEGHREPASKWKEITRKLKKKNHTFTATPYRNDTNVFDIDKNYWFTYTLQEAIQNGDIVDVEFCGFGNGSSQQNLLRAKAKYDDAMLLGIVQENLSNGKIIIRCEDERQIKHLTEYLNYNNIKTLGLHSKFSNTETTTNNGLMHF